MSQPTKIADCMRRKPLTIHRDANLVQAIEMLVEYKLTGMTVVDDAGRPIGVLSELDCVKAVLAAIYNDGDPELYFVHDAMRADINACRPGDNIVEVAQDMLRTGQRRRPVIEEGELVGQVSCSNVLWALMEHSRRRAVKRPT